MIKAILFDLYGTLLQLNADSRPYHAIAKANPSLKLSGVLSAALLSNHDSLTSFQSSLGLTVQANTDALEENLSENLTKVTLFDDAIPALSLAREMGITTALISNLAVPYKRPFYDHRLVDFFDVTVFSCDCGMKKPDRAIYEYALKKLNVSPVETIMVGDSFASDVKGSSQVGIKGIHLVRDNQPSLADTVIHSLADLKGCAIQI